MSLTLNKIKKEILVYCPLCNQDYRPSNMRTVEDTGETMLLHSQCPKCKGAVLSLLFANMMGITLVGLVTDLDYADTVKFKNADIINENDVLDMYQLIK